MSNRIRRVNELIREEVSKSIARNLGPSEFVTVKAVETSRDLRHCLVWISVLGDEKKVAALLDEKARDIEREVRSTMYAKYTPKLVFKFDQSEKYVENITKLLKDDK